MHSAVYMCSDWKWIRFEILNVHVLRVQLCCVLTWSVIKATHQSDARNRKWIEVGKSSSSFEQIYLNQESKQQNVELDSSYILC